MNDVELFNKANKWFLLLDVPNVINHWVNRDHVTWETEESFVKPIISSISISQSNVLNAIVKYHLLIGWVSIWQFCQWNNNTNVNEITIQMWMLIIVGAQSRQSCVSFGLFCLWFMSKAIINWWTIYYW